MTGTPRIVLDIGGTTRYATYASGSGTSTLTFTYATQAGDLDLDGISMSSPIDLNGGTIKDLAGNNLSALTFTPPNTSGIKVNHPSLSMDFVNSDYILSGTHYATLGSFLTAAGGSFTRGSVGTYFDSSGVMQTAAANTPRFDFDPVTHVAKGILLEESRTNSIRNGNMTGAAAGTPGTVPSKWTIGGAGLGTLVQQIVGTGMENGVPYVDYRVSGTSSTTAFIIYLDNPYDLAIPAVSGQTWTASVYTKIVAGSLSNLSLFVGSGERNATGGYLAGTNAAFTPTATLARYTSTRTFNNASTALATGDIEFDFASGVAIDITLRIGGAQLEQGAFATSYIPTTSTAVTRQNDALNFPTGAWFSLPASTLYLQSDLFGLEAAGRFQLGFGADVSNYFALIYATSATPPGMMCYKSAGVGLCINGLPTMTFNAAFKTAGAYSVANNIAALSRNGTLSSTSAGVSSLSSAPTFYVGTSAFLPGSIASGHVMQVKYYPVSVSNTQLTLLTQ